MRILCLVLHLANHMLRTTPSSGQLFHFSEMVDKYDCSTAVMHTSRIWLSEQAALGRVDNLHLCSAYLLDDAESFRRLTDLHIRQASNTSREKKLVVDHIGIELKVYGANVLICRDIIRADLQQRLYLLKSKTFVRSSGSVLRDVWRQCPCTSCHSTITTSTASPVEKDSQMVINIGVNMENIPLHVISAAWLRQESGQRRCGRDRVLQK